MSIAFNLFPTPLSVSNMYPSVLFVLDLSQTIPPSPERLMPLSMVWVVVFVIVNAVRVRVGLSVVARVVVNVRVRMLELVCLCVLVCVRVGVRA